MRRLLAFFTSISALIANRFLVFFECDCCFLPAAFLLFAMYISIHYLRKVVYLHLRLNY